MAALRQLVNSSRKRLTAGPARSDRRILYSSRQALLGVRIYPVRGFRVISTFTQASSHGCTFLQYIARGTFQPFPFNFCMLAVLLYEKMPRKNFGSDIFKNFVTENKMLTPKMRMLDKGSGLLAIPKIKNLKFRNSYVGDLSNLNPRQINIFVSIQATLRPPKNNSFLFIFLFSL